MIGLLAKTTSPEKGVWPGCFPESWNTATFSAAFDNVTSSDLKLPQKEYSVEGALPVIDQGSNLVGGYTDDTSLAHPGPFPVIIFGDHTRCIKYTEKPFVQGADGVKVLVPKVLDARFAYWALITVKLPERGYSRHFKFLKATAFPVPPLNEQRRIASKIEELEARKQNAKEALDAILPLLERFRQSVLAAAFRGDLTADWRRQNPDVEPASVLLDRIRAERRQRWEQAELAKMRAKGKEPKDDSWKTEYSGGSWDFTEDEWFLKDFGLPKRWALVPIRLVGDLSTGKTPATNQPAYWGPGFPFLTPSEVHRRGTIMHCQRDVTAAGARQSKILPDGSTVIVCIGTVGKVGLLDRDVTFNQQLNGITPGGFVDSRFLFYWCKALYPWIMRNASATVNAAILNKGRLGAAPIPIPPLAEQKTVVEAIDSAFASMDAISSAATLSSKCLELLAQSILAKAFRGELVPQDPNDEPARSCSSNESASNANPS